MSRFIKGGLDTLQCEVRRYRTNGTVRWPSLEATEDDNWFTCTLRHLKGLFVVTAFLRHSPRVPNVIHPGFKWIPVADKDIISTKGKQVTELIAPFAFVSSQKLHPPTYYYVLYKTCNIF